MCCRMRRATTAWLPLVKARERHQVVINVVFHDILTVFPSTADIAQVNRMDGILFQTLPHSGNQPPMRPLLHPTNEWMGACVYEENAKC